jgi:hypothetical protein
MDVEIKEAKYGCYKIRWLDLWGGSKLFIPWDLESENGTLNFPWKYKIIPVSFFYIAEKASSCRIYMIKQSDVEKVEAIKTEKIRDMKDKKIVQLYERQIQNQKVREYILANGDILIAAEHEYFVAFESKRDPDSVILWDLMEWNLIGKGVLYVIPEDIFWVLADHRELFKIESKELE